MAKIFDIKHFSVHDGPGIRTTVFFKGCPLRCLWCHNPESLSAKTQLAFSQEKCISCARCATVCEQGVHTFSNGIHELSKEKCTFCHSCESICPVGALTVYGKEVTLDEVLQEALEDRDFYGAQGGVTLSGGECLLQADFCADLLCTLKAEGIHTAVDTCGYVPRESLDKVIPYTDIFLYDLKAFDEEVHERCTGRKNALILENLRYLDSLGKRIEIRIPYVPRANGDQIDKIAEFIRALQNVSAVRVLAYHNFAISKYDALGLANTSPEGLPTDEEMRLVRERVRTITGLPVPD